MQLDTIGKNIRKYRLEKKMRQDNLAEKAGLSVNYVGMVERGEKIPSLKTFISIVNALGVSADMILCDVVDNGFMVRNTILTEKLDKLSAEQRNRIYSVIDALLRY
jgi:transcriptional regulator with XRE-family HTH domain